MAVDEGFIEAFRRQSSKERRLQAVIERIENEIKLCEDNEEKLKKDTEELEREVESNKEKIIAHENYILKTKSTLKKDQLTFQSVEQRLEDMKYLINKLYREEESLNEKLKVMRPTKLIQDELIAKHAEIKGNQHAERELMRKHENVSEIIRLSYHDLRHQTIAMIEVEKKMQEDTLRLRNLKKLSFKNSLSSKQLKETLIDIQQKLQEFKFSTPFMVQSRVHFGRRSRTSSITLKESTMTTASVFKVKSW